MARRKLRVPEYEGFLFSVVKCSAEYHLSAGECCRDDDHYLEYQSLVVDAECTFPESLFGDLFKIHFLGNRDIQANLFGQENSRFKPTAVGALTVKRDRREYLGSLPSDVIWEMQRMMDGGVIKSIVMYGEDLRYGKASITSVDFVK